MRRNRFFFASIIAALAVLPFLYVGALAAPSVHLNWGSQINRSKCGLGTLVVNVRQQVVQDIDSGVGGNYWAYDNFIRHIKVIETAPDTFCATVSFQGSFDSVPGLSPDDTGTIGAGVVGTFEGGYTALGLTGTLLPTPLMNTNGSIGSINYECEAVTGSCPGYVDWTTYYFSPPVPISPTWWGWNYHAGSDGSWVNAATGNTGDITGN